MKRIILITSIAFNLLAGSVNAQTTVIAQGKRIVLTPVQTDFIKKYRVQSVNEALNGDVIKNNWIADLILNLLILKAQLDSKARTHALYNSLLNGKGI